MVVGAGRDMRARHGKRRVSADSAETAEPDTDNGDVISTALRHHVRERKVRGDMESVSASSLHYPQRLLATLRIIVITNL